MSTTAMTVQSQQSALPTAQTWKAMQTMAADLLESGFLPWQIKTWQQALAVIQKGNELGVPPMQALSQINVIQGKPACSAELMLAMIQRDHGDDAIRYVESTDDCCTIAYKRRNWSKPDTHSFTLKDADALGLLRPAKEGAKGPDLWHKKPAIMLRARCVSAVARMGFADSIGGMYTAEEMGATVTERDDGVLEVVALPKDEHEAHVSTIQAQARNVTPAPGPQPATDATLASINEGLEAIFQLTGVTPTVPDEFASEEEALQCRTDLKRRYRAAVAANEAAARDKAAKVGKVAALQPVDELIAEHAANPL